MVQNESVITDAGPHAQVFEDLRDNDPFEWYADARSRGGVIWDGSFGSWLATTYTAVREIGRLDNFSFQRQDGETGSEYDTISGGRTRNVKNLKGTEHTKLHSWLMSSFTPAKASVIQDGIVRDVVDVVFARLRQQGAGDISTYFNEIPPHVIAAVLELPWRDAGWMQEAMDNIRAVFSFYEHRGLDYGNSVEVARLAHVRLREMMDPHLRKAERGEGSDLISGLTRLGPDILPDWTIEDTYINIMSLFLGGAHTSTISLSNIMFVLLKDPALMSLAREDDPALRNIVEQVLRLYPPMHYAQRRVKEDVVISGTEMTEGQVVTLLLASANRDETRYPNPDRVDLTLKNQRDHLTFFSGQHSCIGQGLARAELFETIKQTLVQFPDLRFQDGAENDVMYYGLNFRGFGPIKVTL